MIPTSVVPPARVRVLVDEAPADGEYVLYWMTTARRTRASFALQRAVEWANAMKKPLVVLEGLRDDYPWRSERFDRFVTDGMHDNGARFAEAGVAYLPHVGNGKGLLEALARKACVVVADDYPAFFFPHMLAAAAKKVAVRFEAVDGNGVVPMRDPPRAFSMAFHYRGWLGPRLDGYLADAPVDDPLALLKRQRAAAPDLAKIRARWPSVLPPHSGRGGAEAAHAALERFALDAYAEDRNHPDHAATSGLSPYLHFGQIGAHEIVEATGDGRSFTLAGEDGRSAFLTQVVVWRELGFNFCANRADYDRWESLPPWAIATLTKHAKDPRPRVPLARLEAAESGDVLWDAAQRQLVRDGVIHNYLRMLWGKRLIEWAPTPKRALEWAIELNNKYALDGRDPNSYSGIFWCFGRYDRPWPESPVFGQVRRMTSGSAMKKLRLKEYLRRYAEAPQLTLALPQSKPQTAPALARKR